MTLLEAAWQALPGLEWCGDDSEVVSSVKSGIRVVIWPNGDGYIHVRVGQEITRYLSPQSVALRLRRDLALRRDELDAIAGLRPRDELDAELTALRNSARWVPVGERLPGPDDVDARGLVMIWVADIPYAMLGYLDAEDGWVCAPTGVQVCVTHWQRSPAPPEPQAVPSSQGGEAVP